MPREVSASPTIAAPWAIEPAELARRLGSSDRGLSTSDAEDQLRRHGHNEIREHPRLSRLRLLWHQVRSPLLFLLFVAAAVSTATGEWTDAAVVMAIAVASVGIGYHREHGAETAAAALRTRVRTRCTVLRDGEPVSLPVEDLVPGDVVLLAAGSLVPADCIVLAAEDCHVSEAALTGETFPVEKRPGVLPEATPLARRVNAVHLGTNVRTGTARCVVVGTGAATAFGSIAHRLAHASPPTEFERGIQRFGGLLTAAMLVMVLLVLVAHVLRGRPVAETLLFAIALAVGLSPELLPVILSVSLARGAQSMARRGVLVRRMNAIENLGSMDVLCTDKTGTLTEGVVRVEGAYDADGTPCEAVLELAAANASLAAGLPSPLDDAIRAAHTIDRAQLRKVAEIPFDHVRKRVGIVVERPGGALLIVKGAFRGVLDACARRPDGTALDDAQRNALRGRHEQWSRAGIRVLAIATRELRPANAFGRDDERELTFRGFVTFLDRPKEGAAEAIANLARLGVAVKLITGDNSLVARHLAGLVGLRTTSIVTGTQLDELHGAALWHAVERTDLFAEVDPDQKEKIIASLRKTGHVVGFLGDGVNDAPAMHAADTSLSVEHAVDVARATADFVLLERDLDVIREGIEEGRRTFANTLKYVLTTTSANLGNMVSMALASLFLPFLPMTAGQILLNNLLSDVPAIGIAQDSIDPELVERPRRWDMRFIGRFMVEFGIASSAFDFVTFAALLAVFHAAPETFRSAWFVESLLTELAIALVVRTRRPFFRSRPGRVLLVTTVLLVPVALALPSMPCSDLLGFAPLSPAMIATLVAITLCYVAAVELLKRSFYRRVD